MLLAMPSLYSSLIVGITTLSNTDNISMTSNALDADVATMVMSVTRTVAFE